MKKIDLGQLAGIFANIGVIVGILLLVFELRQNNEALGLQARLERESTVRQGLNRRIENPALIRAAAKSFNDEELTLEEDLLLRDYNRGALMDFWFAYRQVQDGALDEDAIPLQLWSEGFYELYPRMAESWEEFKRMFSQEIEYIRWFEENVANR